MSSKEEQMRQEINAYQNKKDYYDVLGISKSANDGDIKKAYRTLALKFHPDKNKSQGAKDVFKKVSHAYSVLIDPEKKKHYDQFGPEEDRPRPQNRRRHPQQDQEFDQYDDVFRMFFGGAPVHQRRGGNFRTYAYQFGGGQGQGQQQQQRKGGLNFSFILLIVFLVYTIAPLFKNSASFSTIPSNNHKYHLKTSLLQTDFFVSQDYFEESKDPEFKKHSQMTIDRQYLLELQKKCQTKKRQKKRLQEMAYREYPGVRRENYLSQAKNVDLASCRTISELNQHYEDYIRDLTYMK